MKILIAPNAFKETLTALHAAELLAEGIAEVLPDCALDQIPLADGGDGTLEVLTSYWGGEIDMFSTQDPLGRPITAPVGFDPDRKNAVIEMARVSGLALLSPQERDPERTTTYGLGLLILEALNHRIECLYLGIGGSATNDGGIGMGEALGFQHRGSDGRPVLPVGGRLRDVSGVVAPGDPPARRLRTVVLSDVNNPLCGEKGAAHVFGPQKGATPEQIGRLDKGLEHLAKIWERDLGKDVRGLPGAGAAGGVGAGAIVYLEAELVSGSEVCFKLSNFEERLKQTDLVITGEGRLDRTTLDGKLPYRVAQRAKRSGIQTLGVCGGVDTDANELLAEAGFSRIVEIGPPGTSVEERKNQAGEMVKWTGRWIGERLNQFGLRLQDW